jgi:hypothetical protein
MDPKSLKSYCFCILIRSCRHLKLPSLTKRVLWDKWEMAKGPKLKPLRVYGSSSNTLAAAAAAEEFDVYVD